jgi:dipeptidase E
MRTIVCIGGGQLKNKETLAIDEYISNLARARTKGRANALFLPTASNDNLPYFNSFRKVYTSIFDLKVDVGLLIKNKGAIDKIKSKIDAADLIYVGGGDTQLLLNVWRESGIVDKIIEAYMSGVVIAGVSAGGICWYDEFFSDSAILNNGSDKYIRLCGLGILHNFAVPHFNTRRNEFKLFFQKALDLKFAYCIEDQSALVFQNEEMLGSLSSGGSVYEVFKKDGGIILNKIKQLN